MKIKKIEINHMTNPIGFRMENHLHIVGFLNEPLSQCVKRKLVIRNGRTVVFDTDWQIAENLIFDFSLKLRPRTYYTVDLQLKVESEVIHKTDSFETGLMDEKLPAKWIGSNKIGLHSLILRKSFTTRNPKKARLYISGLGLYEAYIDGVKVGDEFLTPGFTNYNCKLQLQTYDLTKTIKKGRHTLSVMLGDGWYRSKLGLKVHGGQPNNYGEKLMAAACLRITEGEDEQIIATDESWEILTSPISHSGIYYGEDLDDNRQAESLGLATVMNKPTEHLSDRLSLPIKIHEHFHPLKIMRTPKGSLVLDFGQNLAGWVIFKNMIPKGKRISIEYGETLQNGEFYRKNLRSARAKFTYISDGVNKLVRPHFTYFGFRYIKLNGFPEGISLDDFEAVALYSSMNESGFIHTDNSLVNKLFNNIKWGQKSNFIDIPTDCPQRDERLGWTGDAAIFAKTASYNMDTFEFFKKFSKDIAIEQNLQGGRVPLYVPRVDTDDGGKAVWSDAATLIPWISYQRSMDLVILRQNFDSMMSWVDWIHDRAKSQGNEYLWLNDDQLGDWLALDTEDIMKLKGKTPDDLIASAFYYYSSLIVGMAAKKLGLKHESLYYNQLAELIKKSFINHFFTDDGLTIADTQTGIAICLVFKLYPKEVKQKLVQKLVEKIEKRNNHLDTGFVGTPLLLPALTENNQEKLALRLFLNEDYPSWLYEVKHGATTIWERWNSIDKNGHIADNGMNSLNHYSNGAVMSWAYESLLGLKQEGYNVIFKPFIAPQFLKVSGQIMLPTGLVKVSWKIRDTRHVQFQISVPFGSKLQIKIKNLKTLTMNGKSCPENLSSGNYQLLLTTKTPIIETFDVHTPIQEYKDNKKLTEKLKNLVPFWSFLQIPGNMEHFAKYSLFQLSHEMKGIGFKPFSNKDINRINELFKSFAYLGVKNEQQ